MKSIKLVIILFIYEYIKARKSLIKTSPPVISKHDL